MAESASRLVAAHNSDREPERLLIKLSNMRANAFVFLRGTDHLFFQRMAEQGLSPGGPDAWLCADLHTENFGTYLGDNDLTYFDINDFDEAVRAPVSWDILRLATSLLVAAPVLKLKDKAALEFAGRLVEGYLAELRAGKPRWIERRTAKGPIGDLIDSLKKRDAIKFIGKRTVTKGGRAQINTDGKKALPLLAKADGEALAALVASLAKSVPVFSGARYLHAGRRIAGTGSLGIMRFVVLVDRAGTLELIDVKAAKPSSAARHAGEQPYLGSDAERVVKVQTLFQANTPGLFAPTVFEGVPCVVKELQPSADRLDLAAIAKAKDGFAAVMGDMARLTAWGHLRCSGRHGAATGDDLVAWAGERGLAGAIIERAAKLATITRADHAEYCQAVADGYFGKVPEPGANE